MSLISCGFFRHGESQLCVDSPDISSLRPGWDEVATFFFESNTLFSRYYALRCIAMVCDCIFIHGS